MLSRRGAIGAALTCMALAALAAPTAVAFPGESDPDADLVRFTITRVEREGPVSYENPVDGGDGGGDPEYGFTDPYGVIEFGGSELYRYTVVPEGGEFTSVTWTDTIILDVRMPSLQYQVDANVMTVSFLNDETDVSQPAEPMGHATVNLTALPFGANTVRVELDDPRVGYLDMDISKAIVVKTLTVHSTVPADLAAATVAAGDSVGVQWDTDGLISRVNVRVFSPTKLPAEGELLAGPAANDGQSLDMLLPLWLETSDDYTVVVQDNLNATRAGATAPFSVRGAEITLIDPVQVDAPAPAAPTTWVKGLSHAVSWSSFGAVANVSIRLFKGDTDLGELGSSLDATGSLPYDVPLDLEVSDDYHLELSGDVVGVRTAQASSHDFQVRAVLVNAIAVQDLAALGDPAVAIVTETVRLSWVASSADVPDVKLTLRDADGEVVANITHTTTNDLVEDWVVPESPEFPLFQEYTVRVADASDGTFYGESPAFAINGASVRVVGPTDADDADDAFVLVGGEYVVQWVARGPIATVDVALHQDGSEAQSLAAGVPGLDEGGEAASLTWDLRSASALPGTGDANVHTGFTVVVTGSSGEASASSAEFSIAHAVTVADPAAVFVSQPTIGRSTSVDVVARPRARAGGDESHVFATLVNTATDADVIQIGVVPLPVAAEGAEPRAAITTTITWDIAVSTKLVQLGLDGAGAVSLRLTMLDEETLYVGASPAFTLLVPYEGVAGEWGTCSKECGEGLQTRAVTCREVLDVTGTAGGAVPLSKCESMLGQLNAMPAASQTCSNGICATYDWVAPDWSGIACSAQCGGGTRTRVVTCVDNTGEPTDVANCEGSADAGAAPATTQPCNTAPCEEFAWVGRPWGDCTEPCGGGTRFRSVQCVGTFGTTIELGGDDGTGSASELCANAGDAPATSEQCNADACVGPEWVVTQSWGACSVRCGGGTMSRTVQCVDSSDGSDTIVDDDQCAVDVDGEPMTKPPVESACNTATCLAEAFFWEAGPWSLCSEECGGGQRTRAVTCVDADGAAADSDESCVNAEASAGAKPSEAMPCNMAACDVCAVEDCSGFGTCAVSDEDPTEPVCSCADGWSGPFCSTPDSCEGATDVNGSCCLGILMDGGECCGENANAAVDAQGECCASGVLDACGVCDGTGIAIDVTGACCPSTAAPVLDGAGMCCMVGFVDACGVCGGDGLSCAVTMVITIVAPDDVDVAAVLTEGTADQLSFVALTFPGLLGPVLQVHASRVKVLAVAGVADQPTLLEVTFRVMPSANDDEPISASLLIDRIYLAVGGGDGGDGGGGLDFIESVDNTFTTGVCGNDVCEYGESCSTGADAAIAGECCPHDCPIVVRPCGVPEEGASVCGGQRRGYCIASTGTCTCHPGAGYVGETCGECAERFARVGDECVPQFDLPEGFGIEAGLPDWALGVIITLSIVLGGALLYFAARAFFKWRDGGGATGAPSGKRPTFYKSESARGGSMTGVSLA